MKSKIPFGMPIAQRIFRIQYRALALTMVILFGRWTLAQVPRQRTIVDLPDDVTGYQVHVLYVLPSDGADQQLDINGKLETSVAAFQRWLAGQTGGQRLRLDAFQGKPDITFFRLSRADAEIRSAGSLVRDQIEAELLGQGSINLRKYMPCIMEAAATPPVAEEHGPQRFRALTLLCIYMGHRREQLLVLQTPSRPQMQHPVTWSSQ